MQRNGPVTPVSESISPEAASRQRQRIYEYQQRLR
jgi:hypothetical protein